MAQSMSSVNQTTIYLQVHVMANRTGTYIALMVFKTNLPSPISTLCNKCKSGAQEKIQDFKFANSHEKTYAVRFQFAQHVRNSNKRKTCCFKNCIVILSDETRKFGSMSYEEKAVDLHKIPLICVSIPDMIKYQTHKIFQSMRQRITTTRINNNSADATHILIKKDIL